MKSELMLSDPIAIDCRGKTKEALLNAIAVGLQLPDWFGNNLDALYDALTDRQDQITLDLCFWSESRLTAQDKEAWEEVFTDAVSEVGSNKLQVRFINKII